MEINNLNSSVLYYKYTTSKLFSVLFMMNVIDDVPELLMFLQKYTNTKSGVQMRLFSRTTLIKFRLYLTTDYRDFHK